MTLFIFITLVVIVCIVLFGKNTQDDKKRKDTRKGLKKKPNIKIFNREGDSHEDEWHTYIAGVSHHASKYDVGGFSGWVGADPENPYDNKAMAVYNSFGKLLGYIPANELKNYREWCDCQPQPCVGFVFVEDGHLRGRVKILRPCNEIFLEEEFSKYLQWVKDNYGKEYLPKTMSMQFETE